MTVRDDVGVEELTVDFKLELVISLSGGSNICFPFTVIPDPMVGGAWARFMAYYYSVLD